VECYGGQGLKFITNFHSKCGITCDKGIRLVLQCLPPRFLYAGYGPADVVGHVTIRFSICHFIGSSFGIKPHLYRFARYSMVNVTGMCRSG